MDINLTTQQLINDLDNFHRHKSKSSSKKVKTANVTQNLGSLYEKARNAMEFRADHLVRRAAIERILKRRFLLNQSNEKIAKLLIKELSWARYFSENNIESSKTSVVNNILEKYKNSIDISKNNKYFNKVIGLCACQIDESLAFNPFPQIMANYVFDSLNKRIDINESDIRVKNIILYIACERVFSKNDDISISYKLLKVLLPNWTDSSTLFQTLDEIDNFLNNPIGPILKRKITNLIPPFNLIRDLAHESDFEKILKDPELLDKKSSELLNQKYIDASSKLLRASKRSIIYIFLTKMVFALLVEIPFELFFGRLNYFVLVINILFPPSLMFLFNMRIKKPDDKNSRVLIERAKEFIYNQNQIPSENIEIKSTTELKHKIFFYIFIISSTFVVLGIFYLLDLLGFSFISQLIFLFFLTVVSFFAYRVREISNEYIVNDEYNESFFETFIDYLLLPIIKVGQFLSLQINKLNILSFIFDFIIEAPLKSFLEIFEDWLHFVRIKKEEILS